MVAIPLGRSKTLRQGQNLAILAFGSMVENCRGIAEELGATLINMRFIKPLDQEAIRSAAASHTHLVTVEENATAGGAGSGVNEVLLAGGKAIPTLNIGLGDAFVQHGTRQECLHQAGLDSAGIVGQISAFLGPDFQYNRARSTASHGGG
jgi:1-deoxy-D-xylulose-5-phosphate synthase